MRDTAIFKPRQKKILSRMKNRRKPRHKRVVAVSRMKNRDTGQEKKVPSRIFPV